MALIVRNNGVSLLKKDEVYPRPEDQANRLFEITQSDAALAKALFPQEFSANTLEDLTAQLKTGYNNMTISINDDITVNETLIIPEKKVITFNLGENSLSSTTRVLYVKGTLTINDGIISSDDKAIVIFPGGQLTMNNTDIVSTTDDAIFITGGESALIMNDCTVTGQENGIHIVDGASIVINDGYIKGLDGCGISGDASPYVDQSGNPTTTWVEGTTKKVAPINVIINDGIIEGNAIAGGYIGAGIHWPNSGVLTVNAGTITAAVGIVHRGGIININGGTSIIGNGDASGRVGTVYSVVGPYAIIYDQSSLCPDSENMELNIAEGVILSGTNGDVNIIALNDHVPNINDEREVVEIPFVNYYNHIDLSQIEYNNTQIIRGRFIRAGAEDERILSLNYVQQIPSEGTLIFKSKYITVTLDCETGNYTYVDRRE